MLHIRLSPVSKDGALCHISARSCSGQGCNSVLTLFKKQNQTLHSQRMLTTLESAEEATLEGKFSWENPVVFPREVGGSLVREG